MPPFHGAERSGGAPDRRAGGLPGGRGGPSGRRRRLRPPPGRGRILIVLGLLSAALLFLAGRLFWLQVGIGPVFARAAAAIHTHVLTLTATRGRVVSQGGTLLAISEPAASIYADPVQVTNASSEARQLETVLALPEALLAQRLQVRGQFSWLDQGVSLAQAAAIQRMHLPGVYSRSTSVRHYPQGMFLGHVLGFVGLGGSGLDGVEYSYNSLLSGKNGYEIAQTDAQGRLLPQTIQKRVPPVNGPTLRLTIHTAIQWRLMQDLEAQVAFTGARQAWGLVMDPSTGAILAMASWPTFDPNHYGSVPATRWVNPVVSGTFPPGSIFKPLVAAAALSDGVVSPSTPFTDPGVLVVNGVPLHDFQRLARNTDLTRALEESADVVFGQVALRLGMSRFYDALRTFGLFAPTGVDLPGEAVTPDIIAPESRARPLTLAEMGYGESLNVTPLSLMTALNAVINGGTLVQPHVLDAVLGPDGKPVRLFQPRKRTRVVPPTVSAEVRQILVGVVRDGTGTRGFIPCFDVGGKTGTSNVYLPGGGISQTQFNASFYTFAPAQQPRVAVLVTLVDPKGQFYDGGEVAAPVAQDVLRTALHDLGVGPHCTPQNEVPPKPHAPGTTRLVLDLVPMPSIDGMSPKAAAAVVAATDLRLTVHGAGPDVLRQDPPPGAMVQRWTAVDGYTRPAALVPGPVATVPDLRGDTLEQAATAVGSVGLNIDATGAGRVLTQQEAPGSQVPVGSSVHVTLGGAA